MRGHSELPRLLRGSRKGLAPLPKPPPQVAWVEAQHRTDVHKGEQPVGVVGEEPRFHLPGQALGAPPALARLLLQTMHRVFEHSAHQGNLPVP
jgi:hypothetical protein